MVSANIPDVAKAMHPIFENANVVQSKMVNHSHFFVALFQVIKQLRQKTKTTYLKAHP